MAERRYRTALVWSPLIAVTVTSITLANTTAAQTIRGTVHVVDRASRIPDAMVLIATADGTPEAVVLTDIDGAFELEVTPGVYVVHVRHRGYRPVSSERLELTEGRTVEVRINLRPLALQLDAVTVYGDDPYDGFMDRRLDTLGFLMMAEDFEEYDVKQMHEVLGAVPMIHRPRCYRAYLDGFPVPKESGWVDLIFSESYSLNAESVYGVEVYRTRREAPKQYRYFLAPDCGVILVWTKRGRR